MNDMPIAELSAEDYSLLLFEKAWGHRPRDGRKEAEALRVFGLNRTRYYQRLVAIVQQPAALAAEPVLVNRLLRLIETRREIRSARRRRVPDRT